jgi:hypothetical protein
MGEWMYRSTYFFFTSALIGGEWSASRPDHFTLKGIALDTCWIGHCLGPRTGLDDVERRGIFGPKREK